MSWLVVFLIAAAAAAADETAKRGEHWMREVERQLGQLELGELRDDFGPASVASIPLKTALEMQTRRLRARVVNAILLAVSGKVRVPASSFEPEIAQEVVLELVAHNFTATVDDDNVIVVSAVERQQVPMTE